MYGESVDSRDDSVMNRLYEIAEPKAVLSRRTKPWTPASRAPRCPTMPPRATRWNVSRMASIECDVSTPPHGHVIAGWLALARADGVVSHESALELFDLTDLIADEVHITLPRAKRGLRTPPGVRSHFTDRPIDGRHRRSVLGIPVTSVERTLTDLLRSGGWTEQPTSPSAKPSDVVSRHGGD